MKKIEYPFTLRRMTKDEGTGWIVEFVDIPDCVGTGDTIEEAVECGREALDAWLAAASDYDIAIPEPSTGTGRWLQRAPKSLHKKLVVQARDEGVSLNTLVLSLLAEALGKKLARA